MHFSYKARGKDGKMLAGEIDAVSKSAALEKLRGRGVTPLFVKESKEGGLVKKFSNLSLFDKVSLKDKIVFIRNLGGMLRAGLSMSRALDVLARQTKKKKMNEIVLTLIANIQGGGTLSTGMRKFPDVFSPLFVAMVKAGEESGGLADALSDIGVHLEKSYALRKKIKGAMIYPAVILSAVFAVGILMFIFVVPTLITLFDDLDTELPASTKFIISVSNIVQNQLPLLLVGLAVVIFGGMYVLKRPGMQKYIDMVVMRLPVIKNIARNVNVARIARTLSSLLGSGIALTQSIDIAKDIVQNHYYQEVLKTASERVVKGEPFSETITARTDLFPIMVGEMVRVGEETGNVSQMLLEIAVFYEEEVEAKTKNLSTIIEPVLMMFIGVAVGFFAMSMIGPMYSILEGF